MTLVEDERALKELRNHPQRRSQEVCIIAKRLLRLPDSDDLWPMLEQVALSALDIGQLGLASSCIARLEKKFPDSPRVAPLHGMLLEAKGEVMPALEYYEAQLAKTETNTAVRKRLIALHLSQARPPRLSEQRGVELLIEHLDTVYNDIEGWSQLAEIYISRNMLKEALSCLADLLLLVPQSPLYALQYAETAYTMGQFELAYRYFCIALELAGPAQKGGAGRRAAIGLKLCAGRLGSNSESATAPKELKRIDGLASQALIDAYSKDWEKVGDRAAGHMESKAHRQTCNQQIQH
ncbi:uncharacterized protein L969DRAFT_93809 [Mixia osmundae IAM 14324]|uniref:ER membrane protein complex subunit 2 n=1 Tax=Mixia osmundae (strain CBS 9802 / IAM 14324 / JCM 22182 / KY 12970) TaxID=764103 RepID=G7E9M9_MIXOS|nr:uncharacterized protein L969DRAFT_93809 [Mixia osmundae IAM 14324]KEI39977.1 hypothetical protein L969DRAFT_93809 [Mixia osmundae IAM 14324]GAA99348.1 hypothetical protein E5Q_06043 [Mixia osmundae IAM 14324]